MYGTIFSNGMIERGGNDVWRVVREMPHGLADFSTKRWKSGDFM
jgi:hypothetical protein